jgi:hypothetical protein
MSIVDTEKIDIIGTDKNTGEVILTISDHLDWSNEVSHMEILQEKLNTYIDFIEGGQLLEDYPDGKEKKIKIDIISQYEFSETGKEFLDKVKIILESLNIEINQRVI